MKRWRSVICCGVWWATAGIMVAEETVEISWEEQVKAEGIAAEGELETWKSTGKISEDFEEHVVRSEREDLMQRYITRDRLSETEIEVDPSTTSCEMTVRDTAPMTTELNWTHDTVWRRITSDRFEIWTPTNGKLYDATGKKVADVTVRRGDGWGREWYGAFLPDGRWITTDMDERDDAVSAFSTKGKKLWARAGGKMIPTHADPEEPSDSPLIAWARSDKAGKAWIVSIGSDFGRGFVRLTPDGKWKKISEPWSSCFPQQLRARGMYTDRYTMSDDGGKIVKRHEAGHGMHVGWPHYIFGEKSILVPEGRGFGILRGSREAFVESDCVAINDTAEARKVERVWFFDIDGNYQHWIKGRNVGASLLTGGLWVRQLDDSCARVDEGGVVKSHVKFITPEKRALAPVEIHDDIGLGLFLLDDKLVLGTWEKR